MLGSRGKSRARALLICVIEQPSISELARRLGMNFSAAYKHASHLVREGSVEQVPGRYGAKKCVPTMIGIIRALSFAEADEVNRILRHQGFRLPFLYYLHARASDKLSMGVAARNSARLFLHASNLMLGIQRTLREDEILTGFYHALLTVTFPSLLLPYPFPYGEYVAPRSLSIQLQNELLRDQNIQQVLDVYLLCLVAKSLKAAGSAARLIIEKLPQNKTQKHAKDLLTAVRKSAKLMRADLKRVPDEITSQQIHKVLRRTTEFP